METPLLNGGATAELQYELIGEDGDYIPARTLKQWRSVFGIETFGDLQLSSFSIAMGVINMFSFGFMLVKSFPKETVELIKETDPDSLSFSRIRYRTPWDLLLGSFRKGTVTVAGDAMHVMGPFIGQGGSAGLEDPIVLARNLAKKMSSTPTDPRSIGEALDQYVIKERRMRVVRMSTQTYLTGKLITESTPLLVKFACIVLMVILFSDASGHTKYDCGTL